MSIRKSWSTPKIYMKMFNDLILASFLSSFILCLQPFCCISVFLFVLYFVIMSMLLTLWDFFQAARFLCVQYICWWWTHSTCALSTCNLRDKWSLRHSCMANDTVVLRVPWEKQNCRVRFQISQRNRGYCLHVQQPTCVHTGSIHCTSFQISYDAPVCYVHTTSSNLSFTLDQLITHFIPMNTLSHFHKVCFCTSISHYT